MNALPPPVVPRPVPSPRAAPSVKTDSTSSDTNGRFADVFHARGVRNEQPAPAPKPVVRAKPAAASKSESSPSDTLKWVATSTAIHPTITKPPEDTTAVTTSDADGVSDVLTAGTPATATLVAASSGLPGASTPTTVSVTSPTDGDTEASLNASASGFATTDGSNAKTLDAQLLAALTKPDSSAAPANAVKTTTSSAAQQTPTVFSPAQTAKTSASTITPAANGTDPLGPLASPPPIDAMHAQPGTQASTTPAATPAAPDTTTADATSAKPPQAGANQNTPLQFAMPNVAQTVTMPSSIAVAASLAASAHQADSKNGLSEKDPLDIAPVGGDATLAAATLTGPDSHAAATLDGKVAVPTPNSPEFADALGARLSWMAERHIGHAEVRLTPEGLGNIDVRVRMDGNRVQADFGSTNAEVRQAITSHLPRLREMLSQNGFSLTDAQVGNGSQQRPQTNATVIENISDAHDEVTPVAATALTSRSHNGTIDQFA